jgi:TolA-binding protein
MHYLSHILAPCFAVVLSAAPAAPAQEPQLDPAATRDYAVAAGLQNKQLYAQAIQRWQKFLQRYPKDPRLANAHNHLGTCELQDKKYADAVTTFRTVLEKYPKFESLDAAQFNLGLALYNIGLDSKKVEDLQAASRAFADVLTKHPRSKHVASALYYQGECLYQAGNLAEAVAVYQRVITNYPTSDLLADVYYALGTAQQELGKDKDAAATFGVFLQQFPKDRLAGECRLRLGQSLFREKQFAEAATAFGQAAVLTDFADADFALMQQAHCLYEQKQMEQAAGLYESLQKKFPRSRHKGLALLSAGKCWYQAGKLAEAQKNLAEVDVKSAEGAEAAYWLGQTLTRLGKPADAATVVERALAAHPGSRFASQLAFARAAALYEQPTRRKESVAELAGFARKHPQHGLMPRALYLAALAALKVEDYQAARDHAEAFLGDKKLDRHELTPDVLFIAAEGQVQAAKPDLERAQTLYRRLLTEHPQHANAPQAQLRIGLCLYLSKKYAEAVTHLAKVAGEVKDAALIAEAHLLIARCHQDTGRLTEAVAALEKARQAKPDWSRGDAVQLALAQVLRAQKKPVEAVDHFRQLAKAYPASPLRAQAHYELGEIAHEQGRYEEASTQHEEAAALAPKSDLAPLALYGAGLARYAKKDDTAAVGAFTKLIDGYAGSPTAARARYMRGLSQQRLGQLEPALKDFEAYLASGPRGKDFPDALYALGLCRAGLKQHDRAAETLAALVKDHPEYERVDQAYYELGFALAAVKKDREAAAAFRDLATKRPDSPLAAESWFRAGEFHESAKEPAEAAKAYAAGLAKAKTVELREKLQYKLGWVQYGRGEFAEAATVLLAQIKEHPRGELLVDATYLAGECLYRQNRFREALPLFEQVIAAKAQKYLARSLYRGGACQAGLKQWPESQKTYAALIEQFPNFEQVQEARYGVAWALQNQEKLDNARTIYEQITKAVNTETAAKSRFMIGEIAFRQKKHREAVEHFLEVALGYPYEEWQALSYYEAGRCFIQLKEPRKAIETLETLVKKFPNHSRARDAATLIAELKK